MRWFLPGGGSRPKHLPPIEMTGEVAVQRGPDGAPGRLVGGIYTPDEPGWLQVGHHWINPTGSNPARLLRLDARDGPELPGAEETHRWLIPFLLRPAAGGLVWAGEERLGPGGWAVAPPPEPWCSIGLRLRQALISGSWDELGDDGVLDLALALYASNYHLTPGELALTGWIAKPMIPVVFPAAAGLVVDHG